MQRLMVTGCGVQAAGSGRVIKNHAINAAACSVKVLHHVEQQQLQTGVCSCCCLTWCQTSTLQAAELTELQLATEWAGHEQQAAAWTSCNTSNSSSSRWVPAAAAVRRAAVPPCCRRLHSLISSWQPNGLVMSSRLQRGCPAARQTAAGADVCLRLLLSDVLQYLPAAGGRTHISPAEASCQPGACQQPAAGMYCWVLNSSSGRGVSAAQEPNVLQYLLPAGCCTMSEDNSWRWLLERV